MNDLNATLKDLEIEDMIWILYIFLSFLAILSDVYERDYELHTSSSSYHKFHFLNLENLIIIFAIYLYFLYKAYVLFKKEHGHVSLKKDILNNISFMANILFVIAGFSLIIVEVFSRRNDSLNLLS